MADPVIKAAECKRRKFTCPDCKVYRWTEDFSGASHKELTEHPTPCDFCKLRMEHLREVTELKEQIKILHEIVKTLKVGSLSQQNSTETTSEVVVRNIKEKEKKTGNSKNKITTGRTVTINGNSNKPEGSQTSLSRVGLTTEGGSGGFSQVVRRKASKSCQKPVQPVPIPTSNRYTLLCLEETEAILVGDSQVRDQERHFGSVGGTKRVVRCLPGQKAKAIRKEVEKIKVRDRSTAIVAQVSGNDLFLKKGDAGKTEGIIEQAMFMVDDLKLKTDRALVIGILPRIGASNHALSKVIGINERLEDMCTSTGVWFVDPYNVFYGRHDLYQADGVHLNYRGKAALGDMVNQVLYRITRSTLVRGKHRTPENSQKAPEELTVEVAPLREPTSEGVLMLQVAVATAAPVVPNLGCDNPNPSGNVSGQGVSLC